MGNPSREPKLPVRQLVILSICRFAEPVALTSVFPYLPEMIESFGVPQAQVAKYAGITSAAFSLSQACTGIAWGRASDRFGRKRVILIGMICTMTASVVFGFAHSLAWAIGARSFAGACSGTVGIIRTTVAEMVPEKVLQPLAFSIMPLVWTIGSTFGPSFGGALANPATKYPSVFGHISFFRENPFALPNMVACIFFFVGLTTGFFFLKETLETKKHQLDYGRMAGKALVRLCSRKRPSSRLRSDNERASLLRGSRAKSSISTDDYDRDSLNLRRVTSGSPPSYREVFSPQSNINLLTYSLLALHSVAFDQLLPVFMHLPPQPDRSNNSAVQFPFKFAGGFGLESGQIGFLFTLYGVAGMLIQFLIFPTVARRYGVLNCLKVVTVAFPIIYFLTPFTVLLPTSESQQIAVFCAMLLKAWATIFAFPCTTILLTNSARSLRLLGTLNGVATSLSALGRAAGPSIGGFTFTTGVEIGYIILPWWTLGAFAALGSIPAWWLVEMDGFGGGEESESEGEEGGGSSKPDMTHGGLSSGVLLGDQTVKKDRDENYEEEADDFAMESDPLMVPPNGLAERTSHGQQDDLPSSSVERTMSSPVGMRDGIGPGGGRRLSNGLGQTMTAFGSYN